MPHSVTFMRLGLQEVAEEEEEEEGLFSNGLLMLWSQMKQK